MHRDTFTKILGSVLFLSFFVTLTACTSYSSPAPVRDAGSQRQHIASGRSKIVRSAEVSTPRSDRTKLASGSAYTVKNGDTLYGIAWLYGADVRSLAEQNAIKPPYHVHTGQVLRYTAPNATERVGTTSTSIPDHRVKVGDSLSVLADKNGLRLAELGSFNNIKPPYVIHPGQVIHFPAQAMADNPDENSVNATSSPSFAPKGSFNEERALDQKSEKSNTKAVVDKNETAHSEPTKQVANKSLTWRWPTKGKMIGGYSGGEQSNKGIDISGKRGQAVVAAADGRVVYAGNVLRGYGNLIIIKHNEDYLSAYAHNDALRVTEQQVVKAGQKIADMGSSESSDVRLHFEIRHRGQSVNPLRYLPKR